MTGTSEFSKEEIKKAYDSITNGDMSCGSYLGARMHWDKVSPACPQCGCLDVSRVPPYYTGRFKCGRCGHEWFNLYMRT